MPEEFAVPYVDENNPKLCDSCENFQIVGLDVNERFFKSIRNKGFICIACIARMWNTPVGVPMEPSAEERAEGVPILEQSDEPISEDENIWAMPDMKEGDQIVVSGKTYKVVMTQQHGKYFSLQAKEA